MPQVTNFLKKKKNERTSLKKGCDLPQITQFKKWGNDQVRKQITGFIIQCKYKYQQNIQQKWLLCQITKCYFSPRGIQ